MRQQEQEDLIKSLIRQIEVCQRNKVLLGKPLLQMRSEFGYQGSIYEFLDSLKPGKIPSEVAERLAWWTNHLNFLFRTALEKREKRRKHLERISAANEEGYLRKYLATNEEGYLQIDFSYDKEV